MKGSLFIEYVVQCGVWWCIVGGKVDFYFVIHSHYYSQILHSHRTHKGTLIVLNLVTYSNRDVIEFADSLTNL